MPKPELEQMVKDAYHDPEILEYLNRNFMYHYDRVIKKILKEHYKRQDKK
jgi:hypothetical protein|tara:strand:+ start:905 stop:1054 length:150 start_codon:yes stop_codon:yes gene_type:complete